MEKRIEIRTGSDSDISKIAGTYKTLDALGLPYQKRILSAHRTPVQMTEAAKALEADGYHVSICAAGGSAHLAGMTASETLVPVVALPVKSSVGGLDSLLSMIQMPPGVPNACVGINADIDAAILAARFAYLDNSDVRNKLSLFNKTKIAAELSSPSINLFGDEKNIDHTLLEELGLSLSSRNSKESPISVYVDDISKFKNFKTEREEVSIVAGLSEGGFSLNHLEPLVQGSHAWVGVDRVSNALILSAQILGIYFPKIRENLKRYKDKIYSEVVEKDRLLR